MTRLTRVTARLACATSIVVASRELSTPEVVTSSVAPTRAA